MLSRGIPFVSGTRKYTKMMEQIISDAKKKYTPYPMAVNICGVKREMRKFHNQFDAAAQA
jgi:hypothetical protein